MKVTELIAEARKRWCWCSRNPLNDPPHCAKAPCNYCQLADALEVALVIAKQTVRFICNKCGREFEDEPPLFAPDYSCRVQGCAGVAVSQTPSVRGLKRIAAPATLPEPYTPLHHAMAYVAAEEAFQRAAQGDHDGVCEGAGCGKCFLEGIAVYRETLAAERQKGEG